MAGNLLCSSSESKSGQGKAKWVWSSPSCQWKKVPSSKSAPHPTLPQPLWNLSGREAWPSCGKYSCKQNKTGLSSVLSAGHLQRSDCPIDCMSKQQKGEGVDCWSEYKSFKWAFSLPSPEAEWIQCNQSMAWEANLKRLESKSHLKSKQNSKENSLNSPPQYH